VQNSAVSLRQFTVQCSRVQGDLPPCCVETDALRQTESPFQPFKSSRQFKVQGSTFKVTLRSVPTVPVVQPLRFVQSVSGYRRFQSFQPFKAHGSSKFKGSTFNDHTPLAICCITSWSEACAGWMLSSPLMTDKNTSLCYLNRLRNPRSISWCLMSYHAHFVGLPRQEKSLACMFRRRALQFPVKVGG
jgi:hypothetical protein